MELSINDEAYIESLTSKEIDVYLLAIEPTQCWWKRYQAARQLPDRALRIIGNSVAQALLKERGQIA